MTIQELHDHTASLIQKGLGDKEIKMSDLFGNILSIGWILPKIEKNGEYKNCIEEEVPDFFLIE